MISPITVYPLVIHGSRSTMDQPRCHKCLVAPSMYCKTSTKLKSRASHGVVPILLGI